MSGLKIRNCCCEKKNIEVKHNTVLKLTSKNNLQRSWRALDQSFYIFSAFSQKIWSRILHIEVFYIRFKHIWFIFGSNTCINLLIFQKITLIACVLYMSITLPFKLHSILQIAKVMMLYYFEEKKDLLNSMIIPLLIKLIR